MYFTPRDLRIQSQCLVNNLGGKSSRHQSVWRRRLGAGVARGKRQKTKRKSYHKAVKVWWYGHFKFKVENYSFHLGMIGLYFCNLGKKFVSFKILATDERVEFHGEISPILARCRKSHREFDEIWETNKYHGEIAEISPWYLLVSQTSRWGLGNLSEMEDISPWSCRDLECHERHGAISAISASSRQSWWDGRYLAAISPRFRIQQTSWRDLGEISAISARSHQSWRDLADLSERSRQSRQDLGKNFARVEASSLSPIATLSTHLFFKC